MEKVKVQTKEELKTLIKTTMDKQGNNADLNFIDVSGITDMSYLFFDSYELYV